ncbi:MAG TPA: histone deacetylase [Candidatus Eisenbacteria bacterium]|nr:histone deacetylase [Candidatus Eisenbacteria bacterium]
MTPCALLVNPEHKAHALAGHPERPERVDAILDAIAEADLGLTPEPSPPASELLITRVHDLRYLAALDEAAAAGGGMIPPDTYLRPGSMHAARTAAGAVVEGVKWVLRGDAQHAFAVVRPCGHHAERATALGFCLINNVAVGVFAARQLGVQRIAVIDFDVHHGNGTQNTFYEDPDLLYSSTHLYGPWRGQTFFPGTGAATERGRGAGTGTTLNIPLPAGTGDAGFLAAYRTQVAAAVESFKPALILVSAGFDAHAADPLAGLEVSTEAYRQLAELITGWAEGFASGRTVWALEGGYDLKALGESAVTCLRVLTSQKT